MTQVAVIGAGSWGKNWVRVLDEAGCIGMVCDKSSKVLEAYSEYRTTPFLTDVLNDDNIDAVVIATPAETHASSAGMALKRGKHVLVEKPMALSLAGGEWLAKIAKESGKVLMVGHLLQYHESIQQMKNVIRDGAIGKLQYISCTRLNSGKLRTEEDVLWSFAPHDISVILSLVGEEPDTVDAFWHSWNTKGIADTTLSMLGFPCGAKAHIHVSWSHPFKEQRMVVTGDDGVLVFDDVVGTKLKIIGKDGHTTDFPVPTIDPLTAECRHFLGCIGWSDRPDAFGRQNPRTNAKEGLRVLRVLERCRDSMGPSGTWDVTENIRFPVEAKEHTSFLQNPGVEIDPSSTVGEGTKIWHNSRILENCTIGKDCMIGQNVVIGPNVKIGNGCRIQNNVSVYEGVTLEDYVFVGPSAVFTNVKRPIAIERGELYKTLVRRQASIGANSTIVCGVTLGRGCLVGAGSVVTKDVPEGVTVYGNPARPALEQEESYLASIINGR